MSKILSKTEIKAIIDRDITKDRVIFGVVLNALLKDFVDSLKLDFVVASTSERNALTDKYAGMLVYVRNDKFYVLEDDLTTWTPIIVNGYTQTQVNTLLANKVDIDGSKVLSELDFTTALKTKLDNIAVEATKNLSDAELLDRSSHTGTQSIDTITTLQDILNAITDDTNTLLGERFVLKKSIAIITDTYYEVDATTDFTLLIDATAGNVVVVLPDLNDPLDANDGLCLNIKKIDDSANTVTIYGFDYLDSDSGSGSQAGTGFTLIENELEKVLTIQHELINLQGLNGNWYKIS